MITVEKALDLVGKHVHSLESVELPLSQCHGMVLTENVTSPIDMPPFDQSAMDGYALINGEVNNFVQVGEVKAGDSFEGSVQKGECLRIFTGAMVPGFTDRVIRQEDVEITDGEVKVLKMPNLGSNIRPRGEQIKRGELALPKGHIMNSASIGFLSGLGIDTIRVCRKPKVSVVVSGNELVKPGEELVPGKVYESNSLMIESALRNAGVHDVRLEFVKDNFKDTLSLLNRVLSESNLIICSGGISVGDYDFIGKALNELGVEEIFYKVNQKPGKPIYFGKKESTLVFGLPGNPAAALTCFHVYVLKAINMSSDKPNNQIFLKKKITEDYIRKGNRAHFLKSNICGDEVAIMKDQSSAMLNTYSLSNSLVYISTDYEIVKKGDLVNCIMLNL